MYYTKSSEQAIKFAEQIIIWKKSRQTFYPEDVLNMMIDTGLINKIELDEIILEVNSKQTTTTLPNSHFMV